jgi:hypothetical protein
MEFDVLAAKLLLARAPGTIWHDSLIKRTGGPRGARIVVIDAPAGDGKTPCQKRIRPTEPGVAEPDALLGGAVGLEVRGVDVDQHRVIRPEQRHNVDAVRAGHHPATSKVIFNPAFSPLSVGTVK